MIAVCKDAKAALRNLLRRNSGAIPKEIPGLFDFAPMVSSAQRRLAFQCLKCAFQRKGGLLVFAARPEIADIALGS